MKLALLSLVIATVAHAAPNDGLGTYHRPISCAGKARGAAFDEGLRLFYAFDLEDSERAFRKAAKGAPCAIAEWGTALALGPNINQPHVKERRAEARKAIARAKAAPGSDVEKALIGALETMFATDDPKHDDDAYAKAMRALHATYPHDADVSALFAAALLDLHPWRQWSNDGKPLNETPELVALIEDARKESPDHPGLMHLYIHAIEASPHPERALEVARTIAAMMPAVGHIVHMPSHIFVRTGRYAEAAAANRRAIAADARWVKSGHGGPMFADYALHNRMFLWYTAIMLARGDEARAQAKIIAARATSEMLKAMPEMDFVLVEPALTAVRFARWTDALALTMPPGASPMAKGYLLFARTRALAATGRLDEASTSLADLEALVEKTPESIEANTNKVKDFLAIAADVAAGDLFARRGNLVDGIRRLESAVRREDALAYDEPPPWPLATRLTLGRVLLEAKKYDEAKRVFGEDAARHPENGWALVGLEEAERRLGDAAGADAVHARMKTSFAESTETVRVDEL